MFARRGVDAFFAQQQTRDRRVIDEMCFNDLGDIFTFDSPIPDGLRINHHRWAMLALIQAARAIGAHPIFQAACRQLFFERQLQGAQGRRVTAATGVFRRTLIGTNENVMLEFRHRPEMCGGICRPVFVSAYKTARSKSGTKGQTLGGYVRHAGMKRHAAVCLSRFCHVKRRFSPQLWRLPVANLTLAVCRAVRFEQDVKVCYRTEKTAKAS